MKRPFTIILFLLFGFFWVCTPQAYGHEVRPAYLELRQTAPDVYDVLWKVPALGDQRFGIYVQFPPDARELPGRHGFFSNNAYIERWRVEHAGGLEGQTIHIDGLAATKIDVLARIEHTSGITQTARMLPESPNFVVEAVPSGWNVSATYLRLGIEHILQGIDHLLFVFALMLLVKKRKRLVGTVTAFTFAHSITLAAATLGLVHIPGPPVEACIALSIAFVASEIIRGHRGQPGLTERAPWTVAFIFGLLHGLGFAGALTEIGLPAQAVPLALLFFNLGVELGQLAFIAAVLVLAAAMRGIPIRLPAWHWRVAPYAIGSLAMFWVIQRTMSF